MEWIRQERSSIVRMDCESLGKRLGKCVLDLDI